MIEHDPSTWHVLSTVVGTCWPSMLAILTIPLALAHAIVTHGTRDSREAREARAKPPRSDRNA